MGTCFTSIVVFSAAKEGIGAMVSIVATAKDARISFLNLNIDESPPKIWL